MWTPSHAYAGILSRLYGAKVKKGDLAKALIERLKGGIGNNELTKIIILDEIDHFINDKHFLYNIL